MPDDNGAGDGTNDGGTDDTGGQGGTDLTPEQYKAELAKVRREAAGYRTKVKELEPLANEAKTLKDAGKSAEERLSGEVTTHKTRADAAELTSLKYEVALDMGLTRTQAKRLQGATREELEADAKDLLESFGGKTGGSGSGAGEGERRAPASRPVERLRSGGGGAAEEPEETDPRKLAARIPRRS